MLWLARRWKTPKALIVLFIFEFALTVAALALYGIADPDTYRSKLWQDGSDNGFNSSPNEILYDYANYRTPHTPLVWSQFVTTWNVVISVLSMFILLVKSVLFVMDIYYPLLSFLASGGVAALYAVSVHAQLSPDMTDPLHPQPGAPWYITKSCHVVFTQSNYGFCQQAKASFAVTVLMLALFTTYTLLSAYSAIPSASEERAHEFDREKQSLPRYRPETSSARPYVSHSEQKQPRRPYAHLASAGPETTRFPVAHSASQGDGNGPVGAREVGREGGKIGIRAPAFGASVAGNAEWSPVAPRTGGAVQTQQQRVISAQALQSGLQRSLSQGSRGSVQGSQAGAASGQLPFRQIYAGPDGR